jgi:Ca-activated chloride channel family protein
VTRWQRLQRALWPWLLVAVFGGFGLVAALRYMSSEAGAEPIVWESPRAIVLLAGAPLVAMIAFHLQRRRVAVLGFSQVGLVGPRGAGAWLSDVPGVLRTLALVALAIALCRPETYRTVKHDIDAIDIMLVVDMSQSMKAGDMGQRDRLDAAQRVIRKFLHHSRQDRIGLVIFGEEAMLQCPLTADKKFLEQVVADLAIGDVPEFGTAIGDGLALALAQLRRSDAKSKVVILLSDGDNNAVTQFAPGEAAQVALNMGVKVFTVLVGREESDMFGDETVNPATLRGIAELTQGKFYLAEDYQAFESGFADVRRDLNKTKRTVTERVPEHQLFVGFALVAALLVALELALSHTWLRRVP